MAVVSRKKWQLKQQSVVVLPLLTTLLELCTHDSALAAPLVQTSTVSGTNNNEGSASLKVMAIAPTTFGPGDPPWTKGEEILPGAYLATKEISDVNLLSGYRLEVIPVRTPQCELNKGVIPFVKEITSNRNNIIGTVGYFCHNTAQHLSQLAHYWSTHIVQISATSINGDSIPHLQHSILPLRESIASAATQLLQSLGWNKIAVISNQHSNFVDSKRTFLVAAKQHGIQIASHLETFNSPKEYLQELRKFGIKIVVAFVPQSEAVDILCTAYHNGFKWPNYVWIFADIDKPKTFNCCCQTGAINNAIVLRLAHTKVNPKTLLSSALNYSAYSDAYLDELEKSSVELNLSLQSNPYADVLYDSIWAIALTINRSLSVLNERNLSLVNINRDTRNDIMDVLEEQLSQLSFQGTTSWLNFSHSAAAVQTSVEILQIQNGKPVQIGLYYHSINQLFLNGSMLGVIPSDTPDRVFVIYPIALTIIMSILIVFFFTLTTVSMCLFIYYRHKPAIKATSNTLSLCMFIGCYFLFTSSLLHTITSGVIIYETNESLRTFLCMYSSCFTNIGMDIVLATVIAKTLRIYHIFKTFGKISRVCSDHGLFILILSLVSVKVIMLITWANIDAARITDVEYFVSTTIPPTIQVVQECQTKQEGFWIIPLFVYSTFLGLVMVLLAILTRKIKRKDYKDSKKINVLVAALILNASICSPLWIIFRITSDTVLSRLAYNVGTMLAAVLCQVLLILPKTVPLVVQNYQCLGTWIMLRKNQSLQT